MSWANLPWELRSRAQWCIAGASKEPLSLTADGRLYNAKVTEPSTWLSFEQAATYAWHHNMSIGYVLAEDDPYSCIDFDIKDAQNAPQHPDKWTTREQYEWFLQCIRRFDSYTEHSRSGKGFHVWVRGKIGRGVRAHGVEVYSQERFIICTGVITNAQPIVSCEPILIAFAEHIRPRTGFDEQLLEELPEEADDWYILQTAYAASNSAKFRQLWTGDWEDDYPSQSEADLALMSMLTFYSPSNEQVRRMFRECVLGQREKARKNNDYLNRTLKTIRSREAAERAVDISRILQTSELDAKLKMERMMQEKIDSIQGTSRPVEVHPLHAATPALPPPIPNTAAILAAAAPVAPAVAYAATEGIPWPPGIAGRIAHFIYQSAPRPVKEVAVVSALGLLAGVCGRAWHIPQSGLNMYIVLVARSAVGKEAMHSGLSIIMKSLGEKFPAFQNFVVFDEFASGPALNKACAMNNSFVNVSGEWGRRLRMMAQDDGRNNALTTLRTAMTNLYQKSGPQAIVGGIRYSQSDNNIAAVAGVSYSMIGETTPQVFYESLTPEMMEDGFLSRFLTIEYTGDRPAANKNQLLIPDAGLLEVLTNLANAAMRGNAVGGQSVPVSADAAAQQMIAAFEQECDYEINRTTDESYRQMWNRAALKAQRIAALLAVADHCYHPCANAEHVTWAIDVVRRDIAIMQRRMETGDVGTNDTSRERKLQAVIKHYFDKPLPPSWVKQQKFKDNMCVTRQYLQVYCTQSSAFNKFRGGATQALDLALRSLTDQGYVAELDKAKVAKTYGFSGRVYQVLSMPDRRPEDIQ